MHDNTPKFIVPGTTLVVLTIAVGLISQSPWAALAAMLIAATGGGLFVRRCMAELRSDRQTENSLRASQHELSTLLGNIPGMAYRCRSDADWTMEFVSDGCRTLTGYTPEDFTQRGISFGAQVIHPDDREYVRSAGTQAIAQRIPYELTYRIVTGDGRVKWVLETGRGIYDDADKLLWLEGVIVDSTAQKNVENQLRVREEELQLSDQLMSAVFDTPHLLIAWLDPDMNFVRVNRAYARAVDKAPEYFIGQNHFALFPNAENETIFRRVARTGEAATYMAKPFEYEHEPERGITHWDWTVTPIRNTSGEVSGVVLVLLDVTQRIRDIEKLRWQEKQLAQANEHLETTVAARTEQLREEHELLDSIINTSGAMIGVLDPEGRLLRVNNATTELTGFTRDDLIGRSLFDLLLPPEAHASVAQTIDALIKSDRPIKNTNHIVTKSGKKALVTWSNSLLRAADGTPRYIIGTGIDISEREAIEQSLRQAKEAADQANRAKSDFLGCMSHELRTPMNAILGFSQILREEDIKSEHREYVDEVIGAGEYLLGMINTLLDLSKLESGRIGTVTELVHPFMIVHEIASMTEPLRARKQLSFESHLEAIAGQCIIADTIRIKQVLLHLFTNAIKFNNNGGRIVVRGQMMAADRVRLCLTDTGPGIPAEEMENLFKPFERIQRVRDEDEGNGIGLALCKKLTELMNGSIGVTSKHGAGSTFWVELPSVPAQDNHAEIPQRRSYADRAKVLYIEDNPSNVRFMQSLFARRPDVVLLTAPTGELGLELAHAHRPDLILLDIHLPGINGFEALRQLKSSERTRAVPVIAVSADAMPLDVERGLNAGFEHYVTKPVDVSRLLCLVDGTLSLHDATGGRPPVS